MRKEETNDNVRLAATTAMLNSLEFTKNNFQNDVRKTKKEFRIEFGRQISLFRVKDIISCKLFVKRHNHRI
jgi:hypothetical protein